MIRGTTPTLTINVKSNINLANVVQLWVTIELDHFKKTYDFDNVVIDAPNNKINLYLSQEDTLAFPVGTAEIQIRGLMADEKAFASNIKKINISKILKDGVIA